MMQINAVSSVAAIDTTARHGQAADATTKKAAAETAAKAVYTPAPPLRPNIQDYIDINRTLIALRKM